MDLRLGGKRALVCGASQGIGRAIAVELAELGCQVCCLARNEERLEETLSLLKGDGHNYIVADHSDLENLGQQVSEHMDRHGAFDILVNNSGGPAGGPITDALDAAFMDAFRSHLLANVNLSRLVLPGMKEGGYGRIINVISTSVKIPLAGLGVSNTTRGAVANWAKTLSMEVAASGVTVNNVLPGATETGRLEQIISNKAKKSGKSESDVDSLMKSQIPAARFGKPEEVAALAAFLASPAAGYINGTSIPVDGGRTGSL